jgi:hypothetical protein
LRSAERTPWTEEQARREEIAQALKDGVKGKDAKINFTRSSYEKRQMIMTYLNVFLGIIIFVFGAVVGMMLMRRKCMYYDAGMK